jgi:replicative DNA helicase
MADKTRDKLAGAMPPPHDDELEKATLGSLLSDHEAVRSAIQLLDVEDFYSRANQRIYKAILSLEDKNLRADIQTVIQELKQAGMLDEAGGASYVSSLTTVIPSSANIEYYAQMVRNHSLRRALISVASKISVSAYDESKEAREVLEETQQYIFKLSDEGYVFTNRNIKEVLKDTINRLDTVMQSKNPITGIPSGFDFLDKNTSGFQNDEFIIIGARPSVGKTALALNMASYITFHKKIPAAFFSLEMSDITLMQRLISSEAKVEANHIRDGFLSADAYKRIVDFLSEIHDNPLPLHIVDMPNMKLLDLRAQARKMRSQQKVEIIFIDYLGLISHENNTLPRYEQISEISRSLKSLARELHIPVVVLCQLNRDAQYEPPTLANLRDSGSIEQDADLVIFLHREQHKKKKDDKEEENQASKDAIMTDIIIAKQRNGPIGSFKLQFITKFAKFMPLSKEQIQEE